MKKIILLLIASYGLVSCTYKCQEDRDFKKFYFKEIDKIIEYDHNTLKDTVLPMEYWMEFYHNTIYLQFLTGHSFRYDLTEPPGYASEDDLKADIQDLRKWYMENKCGMTKAKADVIVNAKYSELDGNNNCKRSYNHSIL